MAVVWSSETVRSQSSRMRNCKAMPRETATEGTMRLATTSWNSVPEPRNRRRKA